MDGDKALGRFVEHSPLTVMTRGAIAGLIDSASFDRIFEENRARQYDDTLKFSVLALSMAEIALGTKRNRNQAYLKYQEQLGATKEAYYTKLNRTEPAISEAVVEFSASQAGELLDLLGFKPWELLPGYNAYSIDGNHLSKTEKRLQETRLLCAAPLPGTVVARFNHQTALFEKGYLLEDAHAQEASVLSRVVADVRPRDLLIADRHYCIKHFLFSIAEASGCFLIRQNSRLIGELAGRRKRIGKTDTGQVFEQRFKLQHNGRELVLRRITVELDEPTRDGDTEIQLLSNVPVADGDACALAHCYLCRWEIENAFYVLTTSLNCELKSNCYPRCALLLFSMAMFAYNARQVLLAALYSEHSEDSVTAMSQYQIGVETVETMPGMLIAITPEEWTAQVPTSPDALADFLRRVARKVDVKRYRAAVRGPKKPKPKRTPCKKGTHVSAAKLLAARKPRC